MALDDGHDISSQAKNNMGSKWFYDILNGVEYLGPVDSDPIDQEVEQQIEEVRVSEKEKREKRPERNRLHREEFKAKMMRQYGAEKANLFEKVEGYTRAVLKKLFNERKIGRGDYKDILMDVVNCALKYGVASKEELKEWISMRVKRL